MEVKLNDSDMDVLAEKVANILKHKLIAAAAMGGAFKALEDRAKACAENHLDITFKGDVHQMFRDVLKSESKLNANVILRDVVAELLGSKQELRKEAFASVLSAMNAAADHCKERISGITDNDD
jgi:hypothetical protein